MSNRTELGTRIAEAMGWVSVRHDSGIRYAPPDEPDLTLAPEDFVDWEGYGFVDEFMRDQGYRKTVETTSTYGAEGIWVRWYGPDGQLRGIAADSAYDEPRAAIEAALKALGESDG